MLCFRFLFVFLIGTTFAQTTITNENITEEETVVNLDQNVTTTAPRRGRIIGGTVAKITDFPYQLNVRVYNTAGNSWTSCGGVIISSSFVLTAAHCVNEEGLTPNRISLRAGTIKLETGPRYIHRVQRFYKHPRWNPVTLEYDVALIKAWERFKMSPAIKPVKLPPSGYEVPSGTQGTVAGWGRTQLNGPASEDLLTTYLTIVSERECLTRNYQVCSSMLCAGGGTTSACNGDGGGALVANAMVVGVISWGNNCGPPQYGAFTKIAHPNILSWIYHTI